MTQSVGCPPTLGTEGEHYRVGHVGVQWGASGGGGCVGAGERAVEPLAGVGRGLTPSDVGPVGRVMVVSGGGGGQTLEVAVSQACGVFLCTAERARLREKEEKELPLEEYAPR